MHVIKKIFFTALVLVSLKSYSAYWMDTTGKVNSIVNYAHTNTILINLSVAGNNVEECSNKSTFAISASIDPEIRSRMYAMLLSAQATGRNITLSYSNIGNCEGYGSNANSYRRIVRLR